MDPICTGGGRREMVVNKEDQVLKKQSSYGCRLWIQNVPSGEEKQGEYLYKNHSKEGEVTTSSIKIQLLRRRESRSCSKKMRVCRTRVKRARQETVAKVSFRLVDFELSETTGQTRFSIVVDRKCLVWGQTDIVNAWNVAALTGPFVEPGDQTVQRYLWA